jgi:hypothetical protein
MFSRFSRSFGSFGSYRSFSSCSYSSDKPFFSPFFASLFTSSFLLLAITSRMNADQYYLHQQLNDIKKELEGLKK